MVTLSIIMEELKGFRTDSHLLSNWNPDFRMCLPLPEDTDKLEQDCLYVGTLSRAMEVRRTTGDSVIICVRDRAPDSREMGSAVYNLLVISEDMKAEKLLAIVSSRFFAVLDWKRRLNEALLRGCSMQDLVDMCPPFLVNHIQITDASFMKLAQSSHVDCDCPICIYLKKYGYHPDETVEKFRRNNLFDVWARMSDIYYDPATVVAKYPTMHKIFKFHGVYYAHMVMTCNVAPVTQAMADLYRIFVNTLEILIEREWENKASCIHPYDSFFFDLLEGRMRDSQETIDRASYAGLPMSGEFYIIKIVHDEKRDVPFGRMMKEFGTRFPRFKFINYHETLTAFVHTSPKLNLSLDELLSGMEEYLEKFNAFCGISSCFEQLTDASYCFRQADLALKYGRSTGRETFAQTAWGGAMQRIFRFDMYLPLCLCGSEEKPEELWYHSSLHRKLKLLHENDLARGSDDLKLLFFYLRQERRVSAAAGLLNMHRNSVIYRINRIEEILDMDLDDEDTRGLLSFAAVPAMLYGFDKIRPHRYAGK